MAGSRDGVAAIFGPLSAARSLRRANGDYPHEEAALPQREIFCGSTDDGSYPRNVMRLARS
jgi:hypothetical protein